MINNLASSDLQLSNKNPASKYPYQNIRVVWTEKTSAPFFPGIYNKSNRYFPPDLPIYSDNH